MRTTLPVLALLAGLALLLTGCGSSAPTTETGAPPDGFPNHSSDEIRDQITVATDTIQSFSAQARITIRSPEQNRSVNAVVRQHRSDSLFMRFSMFGVEGGRLLVTPDSVFFFDTRRSELRVGPASDIRKIVPMPVGSGALFENMLGLLAPDQDASWTVRSDSSLYYVSARGNSRSTYTVDPTRWRVVRYVQETDRGETVQQRLFSKFGTVEGVLIPHQLVFRHPAEDLSATIAYRRIDLNPPNLSLELDVPPQVPRKPFQ